MKDMKEEKKKKKTRKEKLLVEKRRRRIKRSIMSKAEAFISTLRHEKMMASECGKTSTSLRKAIKNFKQEVSQL